MDEQRMSDLISRQAAIDAVLDMKAENRVSWKDAVIDIIDELPSTQPEIIRCKDCKHMQEDKIFHQYWCNGNEVKPDHFCGYAERGTDED